jgi:hypothetical protein
VLADSGDVIAARDALAAFDTRGASVEISSGLAAVGWKSAKQAGTALKN